MDRDGSFLTRSSLRSLDDSWLNTSTLAYGPNTHFEFILGSSPSTPIAACGVFASITYHPEISASWAESDQRRTNIVVIAMGTIFIALLVVGHVFPKCLLALLAHEGHFISLPKPMILNFGMTFCAIEPLLATRCAYRNLSVQDMLAVTENISSMSLHGRHGASPLLRVPSTSEQCEHKTTPTDSRAPAFITAY